MSEHINTRSISFLPKILNQTTNLRTLKSTNFSIQVATRQSNHLQLPKSKMSSLTYSTPKDAFNVQITDGAHYSSAVKLPGGKTNPTCKPLLPLILSHPLTSHPANRYHQNLRTRRLGPANRRDEHHRHGSPHGPSFR